MTVEALDLSENDFVLDICCAPGAKLLYIAEKLSQFKNFQIYGNDISLHRLNTCRSLLNKYRKQDRVVLINQDATKLQLDLEEKPNKILVDVECSHDGSFKHILKYIEPKSLKKKKILKINQKISNREKKRREKQKKVEKSMIIRTQLE